MEPGNVTCPSCGTLYSRKAASCPECFDRNPNCLTFRQGLRVTLFSLLGLLILAWIIQTWWLSPGSNAPAPAQASRSEVVQEEPAYIPNLAPVDIYLTLEENGFQTEKTLDPVNGCLWKSTKEQAGIEFDVTQFSPKAADKVQSITATARIAGGYTSIQASEWLIKAVAAAPFQGQNAAKAVQWASENFNQPAAETRIGGLTLTLHAPTKFARILRISAE